MPKTTSIFPLGLITATPGAINACSEETLFAALERHQKGDWGTIGSHDTAMNNAAVQNHSRILSVYPIDPNQPGRNFWIITEADRSVTTMLLPEEY